MADSHNIQRTNFSFWLLSSQELGHNTSLIIGWSYFFIYFLIQSHYNSIRVENFRRVFLFFGLHILGKL